MISNSRTRKRLFRLIRVAKAYTSVASSMCFSVSPFPDCPAPLIHYYLAEPRMGHPQFLGAAAGLLESCLTTLMLAVQF